jgi:hypothetical protein
MNSKVRSHTARTAHECDACGQAITPGQRYIRITTLLPCGPSIDKIHRDAGECSSSSARTPRSRRMVGLRQGWE